MGEAIRSAGFILVGAVIGAMAAHAAIGPLIAIAVAALLLIATGFAWDRCRARRRQAVEEQSRARIMSAIGKGSLILYDMAAWSLDHPDREPSADDNPSVVGAEGVEKTAMLTRAFQWADETGKWIGKELGGHEQVSFVAAVPVALDRYVHPHLSGAWTDVRGRVAWLSNRLTQPLPTTQGARRSPRRSTRDRLLRPPWRGSAGRGA
jgi:membrane protein implicated in regulation of membrane protease activity